MFRESKRCNYKLEGKVVSGERLITLILLIAIAYISAVIQAGAIKHVGVQKYVVNVQEPGRSE